MIRTAAVEAAFRHVLRHACLPGIALEDAYADTPVYIKQQGAVAVSAASQPAIVAMMLEQLAIKPGQSAGCCMFDDRPGSASPRMDEDRIGRTLPARTLASAVSTSVCEFHQIASVRSLAPPRSEERGT